MIIDTYANTFSTPNPGIRLWDEYNNDKYFSFLSKYNSNIKSELNGSELMINITNANDIDTEAPILTSFQLMIILV